MNKLFFLLGGILAIWGGAVLNDKSKYPDGTAGSKWGLPLMILGGILVAVFLYLYIGKSAISGIK